MALEAEAGVRGLELPGAARAAEARRMDLRRARIERVARDAVPLRMTAGALRDVAEREVVVEVAALVIHPARRVERPAQEADRRAAERDARLEVAVAAEP